MLQAYGGFSIKISRSVLMLYQNSLNELDHSTMTPCCNHITPSCLTLPSIFHSLQSFLFHGAPDEFTRMLSMVVRHMLYLPSQVILNRGDIGHHMYYITKGEVEVGSFHTFACEIHSCTNFIVTCTD